MDTVLNNYLKKHGIDFKEHFHIAVFTVPESEKIKNEIPGLHTKNLFLNDEKNNHYLVCLPAKKRLDMKKLKSFLKVKELHFATPQKLKELLNLTPGSVSIFGMIHSSKVVLILDSEVYNSPISTHHPNINIATLEITNENLKKFLSSLNCNYQILEL